MSAVAAIAMAVSPAAARIEDGTRPLINLIDDSGIAVRVNTDDCDSGKYLGLYRHKGMKRAFILCPGEDVDALDHMVVRHEAIHAIQHCINTIRGTSVYTPIIEDEAKLMAFVYEHLSHEYVDNIKREYDKKHWLIEFEAFAGMHAFTSVELAEMFIKACVYTD